LETYDVPRRRVLVTSSPLRAVGSQPCRLQACFNSRLFFYLHLQLGIREVYRNLRFPVARFPLLLLLLRVSVSQHACSFEGSYA